MLNSNSSNQELLQVREQNVPRGVSTAHQIFVDRARGAQLWDVEGKEYIDFAGGYGAMNIGHNHPRVVQAVKDQLEHVTHTCFQVTMYEPYVRLAERLNKLAPGDFPKKTIFFTTGAEANENAVKIARGFTRRSAIISFTNGFHGRTLLGMTLSGRARPFKQHFGPYAPGVYYAPFPNPYRGVTTEQALSALQDLFYQQIPPDEVAAIIYEPVQGEGGFLPGPPEFLQGLRRIADQYGILLIDDEIQSGFGRTGRLFATEHSGVVPDLITIAKSLAGGFPLSGVIGRADIMDTPEPGGLGGTYAGNPLSCAAGLAVLDVIQDENLLDRANRLGLRLKETFLDWQARFPQIGEVRGLSAMIALEFVQDAQTKAPAPGLVHDILDKALERGLLLVKAGLHDNVIRVLVPVNIEDALLDKALAILGEILEETLAPEHGKASEVAAPVA
jgi:4-aminobutyrate aminotransferase/(S)-3-amino-2-methylpropionate transaminase